MLAAEVIILLIGSEVLGIIPGAREPPPARILPVGGHRPRPRRVDTNPWVRWLGWRIWGSKGCGFHGGFKDSELESLLGDMTYDIFELLSWSDSHPDTPFYSDIVSDMPSGSIYAINIFWHSFWHMPWHSIWHTFWHLFWHTFGHIFWHSFWNLFWRTFWIFLAYILTFFLAFYLAIILAFYLTYILQSFWHIFWYSVLHFSVWHPLWHEFGSSHSPQHPELAIWCSVKGEEDKARKEKTRKRGGRVAPLLKSRDPHVAGGGKRGFEMIWAYKIMNENPYSGKCNDI